jgi:hypothetical protein
LYPEVKRAMAPDIFDLNKKYGGKKCENCKTGQMIVKK